MILSNAASTWKSAFALSRCSINICEKLYGVYHLIHTPSLFHMFSLHDLRSYSVNIMTPE